MKFLKYQNTSRYSPSDNAISINPYGRVVMGTTAGLMLPKGTSAQRPDLIGVRQPGTADGTIRSADHELGITLTHDITTKKTTITFTKEVPQDGTIIKVERSNDKYLKFRDKGIQ